MAINHSKNGGISGEGGRELIILNRPWRLFKTLSTGFLSQWVCFGKKTKKSCQEKNKIIPGFFIMSFTPIQYIYFDLTTKGRPPLKILEKGCLKKVSVLMLDLFLGKMKKTLCYIYVTVVLEDRLSWESLERRFYFRWEKKRIKWPLKNCI